MKPIFLILTLSYAIINIVELILKSMDFFDFEITGLIFIYSIDSSLTFIFIAIMIILIILKEHIINSDQNNSNIFINLIFFTLLIGVQVIHKTFNMSLVNNVSSVFLYLLIVILLTSISLLIAIEKPSKEITFYDSDKLSSQLLVPSTIALIIALLSIPSYFSSFFQIRLIQSVTFVFVTAGIPFLLIIPLKSIMRLFLNNVAFSFLSISSTLTVLILIYLPRFFLDSWLVSLNFRGQLLITIPFLFINFAYTYYGKKEGDKKRTFKYKLSKNKLKSYNNNSLFE